MKLGKTLPELAQAVAAQAKAKHDYTVPTQRMTMAVGGDNRPQLNLDMPDGIQEFNPTDLFHDQMSAHTQIPRTYYDKLRTKAPDLLAENVNHWLQEEPATRLIRTLEVGGQGNLPAARAFLSNKYRPLDNYDLMQAVLPHISNTDLQITSCDITDTRLYIKAISPKLEGEIKKGDVVQAGVVISNSEVGAGALSVMPLLFRLVCTNGMIMEDANRMRRRHTGGRLTGDDASWEVYSDATKQASDKAIFMQAHDLVRAFLTKEYFDKLLAPVREAAGVLITNTNLPQVIERTVKTFNMTEDEGTGILQYLAKGGDLSKWGLANAVTRMSQDSTNYDRATVVERIGGQIVELPAADWKSLMAVAA